MLSLMIHGAKTRFLLPWMMLLALTPLFSQATDSLRHPNERHLKNIRQLTFGGTNAEAYFSFDDMRLVFQSTRAPFGCDQIFTMRVDGSEQRLVSTGKGVTTCAYFLPDGEQIIYASTHLTSPDCIPRPDKSKGYVWGIYDAYDIFIANKDGSNPRSLSASAGYDAEATVSPRGDRIVFTSTRDGDLDLYTMNLDGSAIRRVTQKLGYDGGAFFSWDGKRIVYRAHHPSDSAEIADYVSLLREQLVRPSLMDIRVCDADGSNDTQITNNGAANFAPFFHPDNRRIIFASNVGDSKRRSFHIYMTDTTKTPLEQVTYGGSFNAFPMFSKDGKKVVFVSDRNAKSRYEFNVFVADWIEE